MTREQLAVEVYDYVFNMTESFSEQKIGEDLAYLLGAILTNSSCEWPADRPIVRLLRKKYSNKGDAIWGHIHEESVPMERKLLRIPVDFYIQTEEGESPIEVAESLAKAPILNALCDHIVDGTSSAVHHGILAVRVRDNDWEEVVSIDG